MILMIDNYDSFTYNLVQAIEKLGAGVRVMKNDQCDLAAIKALNPEGIVISPGPGGPCDAGISVDCIKHFYKDIPILGICLGHQSIAAAFGADIIVNYRMMHGKISKIFHDFGTVYKGVSNPFPATRYHSLVIDEKTLPSCLQVSARSEEGEIMGIRHRQYKVEGMQFHPESIMTVEGEKMLANFLEQTRREP